MKKITLKIFMIMCLLGTYVGVSQTLNQAANWPNAAWTLSGSYDAGGLLGDPTTTGASFIFDDDAAGNGSSDNIIATSPVIDLTAASMAGETWITVSGNFTYYALGGDVLAIEVYDADAMTWSAIQTFAGNTTTVSDYQNCTTSEAYTSSVLDISGFTAGQLSGFQYRVSYDDQAGWQYGWCIESPTITSAAPPSCPDPSMLTASNVTDTTANLGWTENGTAMAWDVEVVTNGTPATGTPTATGVGNPYMATGLTAETAYDFYVRADCGGAGTSNWVGPFTFSTTCAAFMAPWTESFPTNSLPNCFEQSGDNAWEYGSVSGTAPAGFADYGANGLADHTPGGGGTFIGMDGSDNGNGEVSVLLSPLVDVSGLTAPQLSYWVFSNNVDDGALNILLVEFYDGAAWSTVNTVQANLGPNWVEYTTDLSTFTITGDVRVRFTVTGDGSGGSTFYNDILIDDISMRETPTCPDPSVLTATNITDDSADLGWTENGTATTWDIEIVDITGGGMATGTPTVSGIATNPYTATGLTENNDYCFYVRADCGGDGTSTWVGPFCFTTLETCPAPSALTATNIMETTADLGWTENGAATTWNIEIVDVTAGGTATGTPTATGVMTNPYAATGLVGDNSYQFYVQADCGVDGTSAWAGPFSFSTPYVAVPPNCTNGIFLDSGGASGNYSSGENITYTICPDMAGDAVNVEFTFFSTENNGATACYDGLTIYDGPDNTAPTIDPAGGGTIWCFDRNDMPAIGTGDLQGMTIVSSDPSGCLTFVFTSDGSVVRPGWEANVTCAPLSIESAEVRGFVHYVDTVNNAFVVNAQSNIASIEVYNLVGQIITTSKPNATAGEAILGSAKNGVYFARVTLENGRTSVVKFVK
ncbi:T9SS type A sorting domain-containing protein [Kordia sp. TARA_039_SRF]|nr:T9SS type A sorting domain-containing protein [Kordia sp. TARA_039_SRF]